MTPRPNPPPGTALTRVLCALFLTGIGRAPLAAQQDPGVRALELERRGDYAGAAAAWREVLQTRPGDATILLGLERALTPLGRIAEIAPLLPAAVAADPSPGLLSLAVRVWTAARQPDSARRATERWAALDPTSELPFQEWGMAAYNARDRVTAKAAYQLGRTRLRRPDALAAEMAQVAALEGDYPTAAREWAAAITRVPGYRGAAVSTLSLIPAAARADLLRELGRVGGPAAEGLAAWLLLRWGDPLTAVRRALAALPSSGAGATDLLEELVAELRRSDAPDADRARAGALEELAARLPAARRAELRLEAAQAYNDGGDQSGARRMLALLANDSAAAPAMAASATSTLVSVLVDEGGVEEADRRFQSLAPGLPPSERDRLALHLAEGWIRGGRLGRADSLIAADSSVEAQAVRGRIALFQGNLARARAALAEAGPFTGERAAATERIAVLGLLQVLQADSLPALGVALHRLELRDSSTAASALEKLAGEFPPDHGGAELLLLAGRIRSGMADTALAERILRAVVAQGVPSASAAAEFALADLLVRTGRRQAAVTALEHLLLTWPTSAVVPQARRLLDGARGAVPSP